MGQLTSQLIPRLARLIHLGSQSTLQTKHGMILDHISFIEGNLSFNIRKSQITCNVDDLPVLIVKSFLPLLLFSHCHVQLFVTPWTKARQDLLSSTASWTWVKFILAANHLILCRPLLLLPSHFPNIRVFFRESSLLMRWQKY